MKLSVVGGEKGYDIPWDIESWEERANPSPSPRHVIVLHSGDPLLFADSMPADDPVLDA